MRSALVFAAIAAVAAGGAFSDEYRLDGWRGVVLPIFCEDPTDVAPKYSATTFLEVRLKMSEEQVVGLIGEPLAKVPLVALSVEGESLRQEQVVGGESWIYTRPRDKPPSKSCYRQRILVMRGGKVSEKIHSFWLE